MKYLLYRLKWYSAKYLNHNSPVHIDLELSTKCKLECTFCFRNEVKYVEKNMSKVLIDNVLKTHKYKSIKFNWRGEALMSPHFNHAVIAAKSRGIRTMLNTSLVGNFKSITQAVLAKCIDVLKVSIDSSDKKIYVSIRKGASFEHVHQRLLNIAKDRRKANQSRIIINRRVVNISEPDKEFKKFFKGFKCDISNAMPRNKNSVYNKHKKMKRKYCGQPSRRLVIDVDGNCWACCCAYAGQPELSLGNINDSTIAEIWNSEKRKNLVKDLKSRKLNPACVKCTSQESYKKGKD